MAGINVHVVHNSIPAVRAAIEAGKDELGRGVAEGMEGYANTYVPVLTGSLKASIKVEGTGGSYTVSAESIAGGATREYAAYVEFGTRHTPAQPYMMPAFIEGIATSLPAKSAEFGAKIEAAAGG